MDLHLFTILSISSYLSTKIVRISNVWISWCSNATINANAFQSDNAAVPGRSWHILGQSSESWLQGTLLKGLDAWNIIWTWAPTEGLFSDAVVNIEHKGIVTKIKCPWV